MNEDHEVKIAKLMDDLLQRLDFSIKSDPPPMLPYITQAVVHLNAFRTGMIKGDEKHMMEITLLKNINNQVKDFGKGGQNNGGNTNQPGPFPS